MESLTEKVSTNLSLHQEKMSDEDGAALLNTSLDSLKENMRKTLVKMHLTVDTLHCDMPYREELITLSVKRRKNSSNSPDCELIDWSKNDAF